MKSTDKIPEGISPLNEGVWEVRPESAAHLRKCMAEVRRQDGVRSVVLDLTKEPNSASGEQPELGLNGIPFPLISATSGYVCGWKAEVALRSHLCFSEKAATFAERSFNPGSLNPDEQHRILTANEMISKGHLNRPLSEGNALETAREAAIRIALMAPLAVRACLEAVSASSAGVGDEGLEIEVKLFAQLFETEDMRLGINAFLGRANPKFRGV